ncbi:hypothetical protein ACFLXK_03070 [Chloroflexota bacterium]
MHSLEVYDPTGTIEITQLYAPRQADLSGKTICELSNSRWADQRTFPLIRELLKKRFPDTKIVPYTEFPGIYGVEADILSEALREKGCDGAIVGNAA